VDFSNAVVVLTTNLGAEAFSRGKRTLGFAGGEVTGGDDAEAAQKVARQALPAELWNRIDERLAFRPLEEVDVARIATLLLAESSRRLSVEKGIIYTADEGVVGLLLAKGGFDPQLGARPMRQMVQRWVEGPLAERILAGEFGAGDRVRVAVSAGELDFRRELSPAQQA
ncbi:MAG TPA: ATP-dependent Clp protease ATP-binding subunit, partial [Myxococcaceae bacterium]|nr:ATP-dependent Clp protease ATP-binding subunit [Myxococcaceae bacterium]